MIVECGYCGAPLDVEERKKVFACRYCGRKNERARAKTIAETTPRDFAPPPVWTPPPGREVDSSKPLKYRRLQRGRALGTTPWPSSFQARSSNPPRAA